MPGKEGSINDVVPPSFDGKLKADRPHPDDYLHTPTD